MAMSRSAFADALEPVMSRWRDGDLPAGVLNEYYAALGGFTEAQVSEAVYKHLAHGRGFPRVGELRKLITGEEAAPRKRASYADEPEFARHHRATERLFDRLLLAAGAGHLLGIDEVPDPEGTFKYPIREVAEAGMTAFSSLVVERGERSAVSCARSQIWQDTIARFS